MSDVLNLQELWLTNLLLLGFDLPAQEKKYKMNFSRDMFNLPNKKGMEVVLHFLFSQLNSHLAYEEFRDCWPVYDKKQEQLFRKKCTSWLATISKEDPHSNLPRSAASLMLSPGGDKFILFLVHFSCHCLRTVFLREARGTEKQFFTHPCIKSTAPARPNFKSIYIHSLKVHCLRHCRRITARLQLMSSLHCQWRSYASQLIEEYRHSSNTVKELSGILRDLRVQHEECVHESRLSQRQSKGHSTEHPRTVSAASRDVQRNKVHSLWACVQQWAEGSAHHQELLKEILDCTGYSRHCICAQDLKLQIPAQIKNSVPEKAARNSSLEHQDNSDNGMDLVMAVRVSNCSLKSLKQHIPPRQMRSLSAENEFVCHELSMHTSHLASIQSIWHSLTALKEKVQKLVLLRQQNLKLLRNSSRGQPTFAQSSTWGEDAMPLFPSTPQGWHAAHPLAGDVKFNMQHLPRLQHPSQVSTPRALAQLSQEIASVSHQCDYSSTSSDPHSTSQTKRHSFSQHLLATQGTPSAGLGSSPAVISPLPVFSLSAVPSSSQVRTHSDKPTGGLQHTLDDTASHHWTVHSDTPATTQSLQSGPAKLPSPVVEKGMVVGEEKLKAAGGSGQVNLLDTHSEDLVDEEVSPRAFPVASHPASNASLLTPPTIQLSGTSVPSPVASNQEGKNYQGTVYCTPLQNSLQRPLPLLAKIPCQEPEMVTTPLPRLPGRHVTGQTTPPPGDVLDLLASDVPPTPFQHANFDLELESPSPVPFADDHEEFDSK